MIRSWGAWNRFALVLGIARLWHRYGKCYWEHFVLPSKQEREREEGRKERSDGVVKSISAKITYISKPKFKLSWSGTNPDITLIYYR